MIKLPFVLTFCILLPLLSVGQSYSEEIKKYQEQLNTEYKDPKESPLEKKERRKFTGHPFFPIDESYRVEARFKKLDDPMTFKMKTSTDRQPVYDKYAIAEFELQGRIFHLTIYQSHRLREMEEYKNHLFLPFTDLTNGDETYGGGRYLDLEIPTGDTVIIDFNKAYNPYCAYSHKYSCPIPLEENDLDIRIEAGIKSPKD